jgi:hypothetical protein
MDHGPENWGGLDGNHVSQSLRMRKREIRSQMKHLSKRKSTHFRYQTNTAAVSKFLNKRRWTILLGIYLFEL